VSNLVVMPSSELVSLVRGAVADVLAEMAPAATTDALLDRSGAAKFLAISLAKLDGLCRREADPLPYSVCGDVRRFERVLLLEWLRRQVKA
jgi:hypothetical protein